MEAPLLLAIAHHRVGLGGGLVEEVRVGPRHVSLLWAPDRRAGLPRGLAWIFLLSPSPELWLLSEQDEAFRLLKAEAKGDLSRRWHLELKGARLLDAEGDPRERWLGLRLQRRVISGRVEAMRLAFQAIPGRGGLRLDGVDLNHIRLGLGAPFPATPPEPVGDPPPLLRWRERWGGRLAEALGGDLPEVLPGEGGLGDRHRAWSLERAARLLVDPRKAAGERRLKDLRTRLERYGEALERDRERHARAVALAVPAREIAAELWRLRGRSGTVELETGSRIELPPGMRAEEAVQRWFSAAKRGERGLARIAILEQKRLAERAALEAPLPESASPASISKRTAGAKAMQAEDATKRADGKGRAVRNLDVEGFEILVGKGDADNDRLTFKVAAPLDFWLHVAGVPGSHVVVRNPGRLAELPRTVLERAAELAAYHSKARQGGKVEVHWCRVADVSKPRGAAPGKVMLKSFKSVRVYPKE
jgi:hypothetical protein